MGEVPAGGFAGEVGAGDLDEGVGTLLGGGAGSSARWNAVCALQCPVEDVGAFGLEGDAPQPDPVDRLRVVDPPPVPLPVGDVSRSAPSRSRSASRASRHCRTAFDTSSGDPARATSKSAGSKASNSASRAARRAWVIVSTWRVVSSPAAHGVGGLVERFDLTGDADAAVGVTAGANACW